MVARIRCWLDNTAVRDPILRRQAPFLQLLILGLFGAIVARMAFYLPQDLRNLGIVGLFSNLAASLFCLVAFILLRRGYNSAAVITIAGGILIALTTVLIQTGIGNADVLSLAFAVPVIIIGLLASRRALIAVTVISIGIVVALMFLRPLSPIANQPGTDYSRADQTFTFTLLICIIAFMVSRFGRELHNALAAAIEQEQLLQHEIDERIRVEAALRESDEQYRLITENTCDLIGLLDERGRWLYASPSHQGSLNYAPVDLIGRMAIRYVHPDDRRNVVGHLRALAEGDSVQDSFRLRHANGSWRWVEGNWTRVRQNGDLFTIAAGRDITERKLLEQQLTQAQRMESIGRLAGGIAHDFNNLLTAVLGSSELALMSLPPGSTAHDDITAVADAAKRAANLTRQLLAFARKQIIEPHVLNLNDLIDEMGRLLARLLGDDIDLVILPCAGLWAVRADPGQIEQVLVNMAVNARDAMPAGGKLTIETRNVTFDDEYARQHLNIKPGNYVMLAISDTGIGMDARTREQIFEPFFTTKEPGKGTGLGLATCYGIIKQHGGELWVYSEPNHGTCFKIYLPPILAPSEAVAPAADTILPATGTETILLVEDDSFVRSLAARVLTEYGYTVYAASCPSEALEIIKQPLDGAIDLLVSDVVMPEMNGRAMSQALLRKFPAVKLLFVSGYTDTAIVHHGRLDADVAFLPKPFSPAALVRKVREVLDA